MNKKVVAMFVVLLAVTVLATSLVGTADACGHRGWRKRRTVETFIKITGQDPPDMAYPPTQVIAQGEQKYLCDGSIIIAKGLIREFSYEGALGTGSITWEQIISVSHVGGGYFELIPGLLVNVTGSGRGAFKTTLEITDGPYGAGTLTGVMVSDWEWSYATVPPDGFIGYPRGTLAHGTGDLSGIKAYLDGVNLNYVIWYNTTVVS